MAIITKKKLDRLAEVVTVDGAGVLYLEPEDVRAILKTFGLLWRVASAAKKYINADFEQPAKQQLQDALAALRSKEAGK